MKLKRDTVDYPVFYHVDIDHFYQPKIEIRSFINEFGHGVYCYLYRRDVHHSLDPYLTSAVHTYRIKNIDKLWIREFTDYSEDWLDFIMDCLDGKQPRYDAVIGPMPPDQIYTFHANHVAGQLDYKAALNRIRQEPIVMQIAFLNVETAMKLERIGISKLEPFKETNADYQAFLRYPFRDPSRAFSEKENNYAN